MTSANPDPQQPVLLESIGKLDNWRLALTKGQNGIADTPVTEYTPASARAALDHATDIFNEMGRSALWRPEWFERIPADFGLPATAQMQNAAAHARYAFWALTMAAQLLEHDAIDAAMATLNCAYQALIMMTDAGLQTGHQVRVGLETARQLDVRALLSIN